MSEPTEVDRYWPAAIPRGYRLAAFDRSNGEPDDHRLVYADSTFERWLCADASELYPSEPWHGPSMGREIALEHGPAWLITDPRWIQGLVLDRPSPAYKVTWRHGDLIAELVVSATIDEAEALNVADQARFDGDDLLLELDSRRHRAYRRRDRRRRVPVLVPALAS